MIATAASVIQAPIQANFGPTSRTIDPSGPPRMPRPSANSRMISGIYQAKSEMTHGTRNVPPPLFARMRGNRQMLPVPTAMLSMANNRAQARGEGFLLVHAVIVQSATAIVSRDW